MRSNVFPSSSRLCVLCALSLAARVASAQTIAGKVLGKGDGAPVVGAIVALLDSTGRAVATKLAEDGGSFDFAAPRAGSYAIRVERVGYRSTTTSSFLVRQGEVIDVPITIVTEGISLRAVKVSADRRCVVRPQEGLATAQLWNEARKALNATQLTQMAQAAARARRDPHRFAVRWRKFERELEPRSLAIQTEEQIEMEGETVTPFVSADPEQLARSGYVDGDVMKGSTFFAPDAAILLSDRFLDTHCFRVQAPEKGRDDLIGLAFEPLRLTSDDAHRVEVSGVLWLDRASAELRYLQYGYVNLPFTADANRAGGQVEFRPLPDGRWIVWRWYIRTPHLERREMVFSAQPSEWQTTITRVREQGAELLEVMPAGRSRVSHASIVGTVFDSLRGTPLAGARVFLSGTSHAAVTTEDGSFAIDSVRPGKYVVSVVSPRLDSLLLDPPFREVELSAAKEKRVELALPTPRTLSTQLCGEPMADSTAIVFGIVRDTGDTRAPGANVRAEWTTVAPKGTTGVRSQPLWIETTVTSRSRYALCGIPAGVRYILRARRDRSTTAVSQPSMKPGDARRLDLTLRLP
jgi:hypothetical protein